IAAICIAPVLVARVLGDRGVRLTIGNDPATANKISRAGAMHIECGVDSCVSDLDHKVVSTPAYMLGPGISDVAQGIESAISTLMPWIKEGK
ncbi:MAG: isoprenoid biosynthesis protein ElbB, partial [Candidatus Sumerlaeota bacterium]